MVPDYFHFLLTGKRSNEYTNASTTELLNVHSGEWYEELLEKLGMIDQGDGPNDWDAY